MTANSEGRQGDILIVDDTAANLRLLSQTLTENGYRVRAVTNGARALESARAVPPDLILLDIRMPEMDGFQVCRELKGEERTRDVPVIFISALGEIEDKVRAFHSGGVDYITKPFQVEEVLARTETHLALRRLQERLEKANRRFERELGLAGKVQCAFLPGELPQPEGWGLAAQLRPARETSGDFYDVFALPGGRLALVVADVVDKGAAAALVMALCWSLIRTYAAQYPQEPARVCRAVNRRLLQDVHADQFVTVFYGVLDPGQGTLCYANAGQCPPLLVGGGDGLGRQRLDNTGVALGVLDDCRWEERTVTLAAGATLILYTDGVIEAQNTSGHFFEIERLAAAMEANWDRPAPAVQAAILAEVDRFAAGAPQQDDMALVVVSRDPAPPRT